jgi:hypothetical protein
MFFRAESVARGADRAGGTTASGRATTLGAADWLCLAAAPAFAAMALLSGLAGGAQPDILCSTMPGVSPLSGMVPMYLLMSAFHLSPWLRMVARQSPERA